jgi:exopolyphosphatase/guanosine-5'-triphosphate,3'-diphosphate pyrophosphatase
VNTAMEESFAAVDIGSNSFHMIVAKYSDGRLQVIDRIKDMVRLASGLDDKHRLDEESMERAVQCLQRFGQRIREIPRANVRAVGTNTLRQAHNGRPFLLRAREALGHPIEIISGREEARLIFLGVAHTIHNDSDRRLVVDIGGGSTELIIGRGFEPELTDSLYMGCVNISQRHFRDGAITEKKIVGATLACRQEMEAVEVLYRKSGWDAAIGSSGTISSIYDVIARNGWSDAGITPASLELLCDALISAGRVDKIRLEGLSDRRRPVFAGGVCVLRAVFQSLGIQRMSFSEGALREGLLYDLIGRVHDQDIRGHTVNDAARRYQVDTEQAERVRATAVSLFRQVQEDWDLDARTDLRLLEWGAQLHEIGLSIAHTQYHRHGAYLLSNADLAGFSRPEQYNLAMLVRAHRRKFPLQELESLAQEDRVRITHLCVLLRLAVVLNRSRAYTPPARLELEVKDAILCLRLPQDWQADHPLTVADLETERDYLKVAGIDLQISEE